MLGIIILNLKKLENSDIILIDELLIG